jgi:hypothetical protein
MLLAMFAIGFITGMITLVGIVWFFLHDEIAGPDDPIGRFH